MRVTIADTGHRMSAETRKMIFDPFFTTRGITGTGLGLWVSAEILNKHGAKIHVRSCRQQPGQGTLFTILFPSDSRAVKEETLGDIAEKRSA